MDRYPALLTENCIKCLELLIHHGWKSKISANLVQQIFSLLVFILDGVPGAQKERRDVPEELQLEVLRAFGALLSTAGQSANAISGLTQQDFIPALGHGITVMIDSAIDGINPQVQTEALGVLQAVFTRLRDQATLANFLPGVVSAMAKLLSTPNRHKTLVLAKCLAVVQTALTQVLGDMRTRSVLPKEGNKVPEVGHNTKEVPLTPDWVKETSAQVKRALASMIKLRMHDSETVRDALGSLCISLLDECHASLSNCSTLLVETAIMLGVEDNEFPASTATQVDLSYLATIYPELADTVKSTIYSWMSSLPRLMQTGDEDAKTAAVVNLSKGFQLLQQLAVESSTLEDSMADTLRDSLVSLMQDSRQPRPKPHLQLLDESGNSKESSPEQAFEPILVASESQRKLRQEITSLIRRIGSSSSGRNLAVCMMDHARESKSADQVASLWLCFEIVRAANVSNAESERYLDFPAFSSPSDDVELVSEDLYSYSVQILETHEDSPSSDWRLEAIALEVVAYQATRQGELFRPHLVDVLFAIATFLGSKNQILQQHAIASLNTVALSCNYANVAELIIDNVDYMVNSVSLRLDSLDISPASMQVLLMMIRLTGARLIPYLNDVVESIFGVLDSYHGYTSFAENLFSVLKEIVDQASHADGLLTEGERNMITHKKEPRAIRGMSDLMEHLDRREARRLRDQAEQTTFEEIKGHPKEPWKSAFSDDTHGEAEASQPPQEPEPPPNSPTYELLHRISCLTQHYLTSPTPQLRRSLLELLTTASSILGGDEDRFLPLVNAVWPVVVERLRDPEAFVGIEACHALSGLCAAAGDFLSTRFKTEWGDWLKEWCFKVKKQQGGANAKRPTPSSHRERGSNIDKGDGIMIPLRSGNGTEIRGVVMKSAGASAGSLGQHASQAKMWEAVVQLLTAIALHVRTDGDMFDDMVELLVDVLESNQEVRQALETVNADAVWLARYEKGRVEHVATPVMEGVKFADMKVVAPPS
ncbi:hypothetical protein UVI_02037590 [Ustilaginoidea virens]|nr:hypothetical protein UVI_02037590 [Ustilaginoidea virens]